MNNELLAKMRNAVSDKIASVLTVDEAKKLIGKRIQTIYYGYHGQDDVDDFVVGSVKHEIYRNGEQGEICLFTPDNRNTFIRAHKENDGAFTCSDSDRFVYYIVVDEN
jgi:hypothetical protein